ncbi:hypothetical protein F0562_016685 [Nyssa sinensis]|uniref:C2H2-type domain-containing protein n=1 Tax=Nyssa sinensis TaxID=561372 RepID=A0A5J4ZFF4_9ASTE|nr:hypothetical protein F0562_016685 [Nyssa sinensis]
MEQARYWMWTKRKHGLNSHVQASTDPSYGDSWEEQAFAEDAAGPLGGCIWPPRSYSCNFCRREFRSAQALGGHMNVHRRDRARLKQCPSPNNEILQLHHQNLHNHVPNPCTSLDVQFPSQICTLVYNPNHDSNHGVLTSTSSPSRVSAPSMQENCSEKTMVPPFSSPIVQEHHKRTSSSSPKSWSNLVADREIIFSDPKNEGDKNSNSKLESGCRAKGDYVKADLSVSLNLVVRRTCPTVSSSKEGALCCKRQRTDTTPLPFFLKPNSVDRHHLQSKVLEFSPSSIEDVDLELRLGDRPKALGGHMNIHRKDRAKLKEFSDETLIPVDMAKKNPSDQVPEDDNSLQAKTSEEKSSSPNRPSIFSREDDDASRSKDGTIGELHAAASFRRDAIDEK